MKLELKHIAPYLPYGLKVAYVGYGEHEKEIKELVGLNINSELWIKISEIGINNQSGEQPKNIKPILRPLSDLTKKIEHNGEKFVPSKKIENDFACEWGSMAEEILFPLFDKNHTDIKIIPFNIMLKLFEWHFDVFNLIENNLAIDINTLNN